MEKKQKRGTKPKERQLAKHVPGQPVMPKDFDKDEKAAWKKIVDSLSLQGTLSETDSHLLELYSRTYVIWLRCVNAIKSEPLTSGKSDEDGNLIGRAYSHPLMAQAANNGDKLRAMLDQLTLTVKSRAKQPLDPRDDLGEWEGVL